MLGEWQKEVQRHMMVEDIDKLTKQLKKARIDLSQKRGQLKRLRLLTNYVLAAMSEKDFDSDPAIQKAFDKCDKAGDLS